MQDGELCRVFQIEGTPCTQACTLGVCGLGAVVCSPSLPLRNPAASVLSFTISTALDGEAPVLTSETEPKGGSDHSSGRHNLQEAKPRAQTRTNLTPESTLLPQVPQHTPS